MLLTKRGLSGSPEAEIVGGQNGWTGSLEVPGPPRARAPRAPRDNRGATYLELVFDQETCGQTRGTAAPPGPVEQTQRGESALEH